MAAFAFISGKVFEISSSPHNSLRTVIQRKSGARVSVTQSNNTSSHEPESRARRRRPGGRVRVRLRGQFLQQSGGQVELLLHLGRHHRQPDRVRDGVYAQVLERRCREAAPVCRNRRQVGPGRARRRLQVPGEIGKV